MTTPFFCLLRHFLHFFVAAVWFRSANHTTNLFVCYYLQMVLDLFKYNVHEDYVTTRDSVQCAVFHTSLPEAPSMVSTTNSSPYTQVLACSAYNYLKQLITRG